MTPGEELRKLAEKLRPDNCCEKKPMFTSGQNEPMMLCSDICLWQALDLVICNIIIGEDIHDKIDY